MPTFSTPIKELGARQKHSYTIDYMKLVTKYILILTIISLNLNGQSRIISGRVIDEDLATLPGVMIQNSDTVLLSETDFEGNFTSEIPVSMDTLLVRWIAMEWKTIKLSPNCDAIDIILMYDVIYDFMMANRIDRLRLKRFKKLPELHQKAFEKGLFTTKQPCYEQSFVPIKKRLNAIK